MPNTPMMMVKSKYRNKVPIADEPEAKFTGMSSTCMALDALPVASLAPLGEKATQVIANGWSFLKVLTIFKSDKRTNVNEKSFPASATKLRSTETSIATKPLILDEISLTATIFCDANEYFNTATPFPLRKLAANTTSVAETYATLVKMNLWSALVVAAFLALEPKESVVDVEMVSMLAPLT